MIVPSLTLMSGVQMPLLGLEPLTQMHCCPSMTEYIDLYLVHWPGVEGLHPGDSRHSEYRAQSWATLEFYASRQFRAIGVSNYNAKHIRELLMSCRVPPVVLQIECQPKLIQRELRDLCIETGIHFQAYSSLGTGALLREPEVMDIVRSCGRTPAQVLLRWAVQQGIVFLVTYPSIVSIKEMAEQLISSTLTSYSQQFGIKKQTNLRCSKNELK
uniref:Zgc:110782 n=1 Tax=Sinocyclocheilus anshuiensis TaxID=1608454 RepID=A0A671S9Z2_9TELE